MIDYHIDVHRRVVTTRVTGRLTFSELASHLQRLIRDPKFSSEFNALIIAMDQNAVPSANAVSALAPMVRAWSKRRVGVKWAFVLPNQAARTFAESALNELRLTTLTTRCFLAESAAQAWLEPTPAAKSPAVPPEGRGAAAWTPTVRPDHRLE